jgi:AraC family transcriptional regulator
MLAGESPASTRSIAESLNLHPAWLARRYRQATGEGLHETLRRKRVERALTALRASDAPLAEVALDSGFCDQPHMNRCFRQVLGQSPQAYRSAAQAR